MATLAASAGYVNAHLTQLLPAPVIAQIARDVGHRWRQRKLGPVQTVVLLIVQMLAANASLAQLRAINDYRTSVSALAKARDRLPVALLHRLLDWLLGRFRSDGARVLRIDCSNTYTQDTPPLRKKYRHPKQKRQRCDYPQLRSICVFDVLTGLLLAEHRFASDRHESPQLKHLLPMLSSGDIVIFDRGFVSYANLCMLQARGVAGVARLPKTLRARPGSRRQRSRRLSKNDRLVRWSKPAQRTRGITQARWRQLPEELNLRQISFACQTRYRRCRRLTVITTLLNDKTHSKAMIGQWYGRRWEIETDFRHLKQTLGLEILRTQSPKGVERELLLRAIAYNLVRIVMLQAAAEKKTTCDRISFADACRWLFVASTDVPLTKLLTNPRRTRRPRPRKVKHRGKNYRYLTHRVSQAGKLK
jgi:hypothetical protein